jgi:cardiolipin synthase A/B
MTRHTPPARLSWPWRTEGQARLVPGGDDFLAAIRAQLDAARHSIDIELYLCSSGALFEDWLQVLDDAAARGVQVRMLLDDVGSHGLNQRDRERLDQSRVTLRWFNPLRFGHPVNALIRDHRKIIIIDGEYVWTGGMGLDDNYSAHHSGNQAWRDLMVCSDGPVAGDALALFEQAWALADAGALRGALRWRLHHDVTHSRDEAPASTPAARLTAARGGRRNPLLRSVIRRIGRAREQVWLCTPYFLPPRPLYKALQRAARRGVTVRLLVCGPCTDHPIIRFAGQHLYGRLLRAGVEIHEFQPCFIHLKAVRVDRWCTLGSFNYDRWNSSWNLEANVEWQDDRLCSELDALREQLQQECRAMDYAHWRRRGLVARLRESLMFWFGTRLLRALHALR